MRAGPEADPELAGGIFIEFISLLGMLRIPQEVLESVAGERDVWVSLLDLLSL